MRTLLIASLLAIALSSQAEANDGYAAIGAGGLEFGKSQSIEMVTEDLYLSRSRVTVDYLFRNTGPEEAVVIAFQLPPLAPGDVASGMALPGGVYDAPTMNYLDFTAAVDGKPVKLRSEISYYLPNPDEPYLWGLAALENPGPEVTQRLSDLGVPETYDLEAIRAWFAMLPAKERKALLQEGIFESQPEGGPTPRYLVGVRFWWEQRFNAGQELAIHHDYTPVLGASVYHVSDDMVADYCIDTGTMKAMDKVAATAMADNSNLYILLGNLEYVLRTANTWKGSIGRFRMTLDKEDPKAIVSLCADGLKKTSPTTFVLERTNYNPSNDIRVLFTAALPLE